MQQNPLITYLRFAGLALGAVLFAVMLYRTSQMANNPVYVQGKPYMQQVDTFAYSQANTTDPGSPAPAAAIAVQSSSSSSEESQPMISNAAIDGNEANQVAKAEIKQNQEAQSATAKALSILKHLD